MADIAVANATGSFDWRFRSALDETGEGVLLDLMSWKSSSSASESV
jgi:hypothetical protein